MLDLVNIEKRIDEALKNETCESLTIWLYEKRKNQKLDNVDVDNTIDSKNIEKIDISRSNSDGSEII